MPLRWMLLFVVLSLGCGGHAVQVSGAATAKGSFVASRVHPEQTTPAATVSVRIATFNLQVFGEAKAKKAHVVRALAAIIAKYDLVAVQEIKNKDQTAPPVLLAALRRLQPAFEMALSPRGGQQPDDRNHQEQYAYLYRRDRLRQLGDHGLFDDSAHDYFQREPHVARFAVAGACENLVVINIHTPPDRALTEIAAIEHVFSWAKGHYANDQHFIALGDFNAGCGYASEDDLNALPLHGKEYDWVVPHSADTNLADSQCPYDRMVVQSSLGNALVRDWNIDHAVEDATISDHYPVWAEIAIPVSPGCDT